LPEGLFANPVWHALHTRHRHFAVTEGDACRYPRDVAPLAAVAEPTAGALKDLSSLLEEGESLWLVGERYPPVPELSFEGTLACLQMILPEEVAAPDSAHEVVQLSDSREMVELTDVAFPGFFRSQTCLMGSYYGVRHEGELIAMAGERVMLDGYAEISGVCTRREHRGKGLAAALIWRLVRDHRRDGIVSWLHVGCENRGAIELYLRMGFRVVREVVLHRVSLAKPQTVVIGM
jgi:ribosomal protein S18 acetylase RimI-like enzyme